MSRLALLLALLGACWGTTTPTTTPANVAAPTTITSTAAPEVRHDATGFQAIGLPAIQRDGQRVVLAQLDADGARGHRNLRLVIKDRSDAELESMVVMTVDEQELLDAEMQATPALRTRLEAANKLLAALHTTHTLVPLFGLQTDANRIAPADITHVTGENLAIEWSIAGHLKITSNGLVVLERDEPTWLARPRRGGCTNAAYVDAAHAAPSAKLVVLSIGYRGDDACWEPDNQLHVVAW